MRWPDWPRLPAARATALDGQRLVRRSHRQAPTRRHDDRHAGAEQLHLHPGTTDVVDHAIVHQEADVGAAKELPIIWRSKGPAGQRDRRVGGVSRGRRREIGCQFAERLGQFLERFRLQGKLQATAGKIIFLQGASNLRPVLGPFLRTCLPGTDARSGLPAAAPARSAASDRCTGQGKV